MSEEGRRIVPFAELPALAGEVFVGQAFHLTAEGQDQFERATWIDRVYTDPDPPEFPDAIIEGFYALAMLDALQNLTFRVDPDQAYGYNYGTNRVRFVSPMLLGEQIKPTFEIKEVKRRGDGFLMTMSCRLQVVGATRPGMLAEWLLLVLPREGFELDDRCRIV